MRRLGCALAAAIAAPALASPAVAGQYELHSCRLPDGRAIPAFGWLGAYGNGEWLRADDTCAQGGALSAALTGVRTYEHPQEAFAVWRLEAPPGTAIRRLRGHFAFSTSPGRPYGSPVVDADGYERQGRFGIGPGSRSGSFAAWNDPGNERDTGPITATRGFRVVVRCVGGGAPCPYGGEDTGRADIFRAQTTLEDLADPAVQRIGGPFLEPGVHRGLEHLHLEASDAGSGVYRLRIELDGAEVLRQVIDPNAGACADALPDDEGRDFVDPVPCKLAVNGSETVDTRLLPDGPHRLRVVVEDAAGNTRLAAGPVDGWTVGNAAVPAPAIGGPSFGLPAGGRANGVPATTRARLALSFVTAGKRCRRVVGPRGRIRRRCRRASGRSRRAALSVPYPRGVGLAGRLTTRRGRPIRGARVVVRRAVGAGRPNRRLAARTGPGGRFRLRLGRSPTERIRAAYFPTWRSRRPVLSRTLIRRTPAPVRVRLRSRRLPAGGRVVILGRLRGGRRPSAGVPVVADVRLRGHWTEFAQRRVGAGGRFRASGRFHVRGRFALRARVLSTPGYPFEPSASRAVAVTVW